MMDRISIYEALPKWNEMGRFLKRMVTGDEKLVTYDNTVQKQSWSKPISTVNNGPFEASNRPESANRRGVVFHQDNARPHSSIVTRQKLWELGWEVLMHPPYGPDLAPNDYHLFLPLHNFLSDKNLGSREDYENPLLEFFVNKSQDFYERGNMKLPLKWQQIIQQNDLKKCWGYEKSCSPNLKYSTPSCNESSRGWAKSKEEQIDLFFKQGDFGYIRERIDELTDICVPKHKNGSFLECSKFMRFCRGKNIMFDFETLTNLPEPMSSHASLESELFIH
ncbi:EGF domain-specific O-linked N-acetylglucosamine transferase [Trichonephila clavipes]|nr:EGF domain-specific O-linked N-acetylglucosamine transferase [Trichonephila clavipes]